LFFASLTTYLVRNYLLAGAYGWGYPYGWGVEVPMLDDTLEEHKTVKEVKSVKKESKKKDERLHSKHNPFIWGVNDHSDVEEIMDGFIE
jgi:hypothetical protein